MAAWLPEESDPSIVLLEAGEFGTADQPAPAPRAAMSLDPIDPAQSSEESLKLLAGLLDWLDVDYDESLSGQPPTASDVALVVPDTTFPTDDELAVIETLAQAGLDTSLHAADQPPPAEAYAAILTRGPDPTVVDPGWWTTEVPLLVAEPELWAPAGLAGGLKSFSELFLTGPMLTITDEGVEAAGGLPAGDHAVLGDHFIDEWIDEPAVDALTVATLPDDPSRPAVIALDRGQDDLIGTPVSAPRVATLTPTSVLADASDETLEFHLGLLDWAAGSPPVEVDLPEAPISTEQTILSGRADGTLTADEAAELLLQATFEPDQLPAQWQGDDSQAADAPAMGLLNLAPDLSQEMLDQIAASFAVIEAPPASGATSREARASTTNDSSGSGSRSARTGAMPTTAAATTGDCDRSFTDLRGRLLYLPRSCPVAQ